VLRDAYRTADSPLEYPNISAMALPSAWLCIRTLLRFRVRSSSLSLDDSPLACDILRSTFCRRGQVWSLLSWLFLLFLLLLLLFISGIVSLSELVCASAAWSLASSRSE